MEVNFGPELKEMANVLFSESTDAKSSTFIDSSSGGSTERSTSEYGFDSQIESSLEEFSEIQLLEHWKAKSDYSQLSMSGRESSIVQTELLDSLKYVQQDFSAASVVDSELLYVSARHNRENRKIAEMFNEPSLTISQPMTVAASFTSTSVKNIEDTENERVLLEQTLVLLKHSNEATEKMIREENAALDEENKIVDDEVKKMHDRLDLIEGKLENEFQSIADHTNLMNEKLDKALALEADYSELATKCAKLMDLFPELDQTGRYSTHNIALADNIINMANRFDESSFPVDGDVDMSICKNTAEVSSAISQLDTAMKAFNSNVWGSIMKNSEAAQLIEDTMDHLNRIDRLYTSEFPPMDSHVFSAYLAQQHSIISVQSNTSECSSQSVSRLSVDSSVTSVIKAPPTPVTDCEETQVEPNDDIKENTGIENVLQRIASQVKTALSSLGSISSSDLTRAAPVSADSSSGGLLLANTVKSETDLQTASACASTASLISSIWSQADRYSDSSNRSIYLSNKSDVYSTGSHLMDFEDSYDGQDSTNSASSPELSFPDHTLYSFSSMRPSSDVFTALRIDSITDMLEQTQVSSSSETVY